MVLNTPDQSPDTPRTMHGQLLQHRSNDARYARTPDRYHRLYERDQTMTPIQGGYTSLCAR